MEKAEQSKANPEVELPVRAFRDGPEKYTGMSSVDERRSCVNLDSAAGCCLIDIKKDTDKLGSFLIEMMIKMLIMNGTEERFKMKQLRRSMRNLKISILVATNLRILTIPKLTQYPAPDETLKSRKRGQHLCNSEKLQLMKMFYRCDLSESQI